MSNVRNYILTIKYDKDKAKGFAVDTAKGRGSPVYTQLNLSNYHSDLESNQSTLIEVVQSLGDYIKDEDSTVRSRAVSFLSEVISTLPSKFLSRQQTQVLCQFLCDRIEDGGAITALGRLQASERFNKEMAEMMFRA